MTAETAQPVVHLSLFCKLQFVHDQDRGHRQCSGTCDGHGSGMPCRRRCACVCHARGQNPEQITRESFLSLVHGELESWLPREPRTRTSWWMFVQEIAAARFNAAYAEDFPKERDPQEVAAMRAERGRGRESLRPGDRASTRQVPPKE